MIYLGIDCGATTSKIAGISGTGECLSETLRQSSTRSEDGPQAMVAGWLQGANEFLSAEGYQWDDVAAVGIAIPGPYLEYGVLGVMPNMPEAVHGWRFLDALAEAITQVAHREIPVVTANDGQLAGLSEAQLLQRESPGSVMMFAPGSGLGCSFVQTDGTLLKGDHLSAAALCHLPAPVNVFAVPPLRCGCGAGWNCIEPYTSISGLPQLVAHFLPKYPDHPFHESDAAMKEKVLSLRSLAQSRDPLAEAIFDFQGTALGYAVAMASRIFDPTHIVIGGGLMDPTSTTPEFRKRYLSKIEEGAQRFHWIGHARMQFHEAKMGELSQAVGAALLARVSFSDTSVVT